MGLRIDHKGVGPCLSCKPSENPMAVADIFYGQLPFPETFAANKPNNQNQPHNLRVCKLNMEASLVIALIVIEIVKL